MKAIITIIILALAAWGIWWFARGNDVADVTDTPAGQVQGDSDTSLDADVDLSQFDSKG